MYVEEIVRHLPYERRGKRIQRGTRSLTFTITGKMVTPLTVISYVYLIPRITTKKTIQSKFYSNSQNKQTKN